MKKEVISVEGRRVKVIDVASSKTGKHGSAKTHLVGIDLETGKKVERVVSSSELSSYKEVEEEDISDEVEEDSVYYLITGSQSEDGSWSFDKDFLATCGVPMDEFAKLFNTLTPLQERLFATVSLTKR
jgi:hypothetical protein